MCIYIHSNLTYEGATLQYSYSRSLYTLSVHTYYSKMARDCVNSIIYQCSLGGGLQRHSITHIIIQYLYSTNFSYGDVKTNALGT